MQAQVREAASDFVGLRGRSVERSGSGGVFVVIDHERALIAEAIGPGEDVLIDSAILAPEVKEGKVLAFGEDVAFSKQRRDLALMAFDEMMVWRLLVARMLVLHAVLFREGFNLAVAEHWQAGEGRHHGADAEVFVAGAKLIDSGALVGIAHEVDIALEDIGGGNEG